MPGAARQADTGSHPLAMRLGVLLGSLVFCVAAIGSGLDRAFDLSPRLAGNVPAPFAAESLRIRALDRLETGDARGAADLARELVTKAPIDPSSTALLGAAWLYQGQPQAAERAFLLAGRMGWRVPLTQQYWMGRAIQLGDYPVAAERLDAVLRQQPELLSQRALLDPLERDPLGRQAMAERLSLRPDWLDRYTNDVGNVASDVLVLRADVLDRLAAAGTVLGCDGIGVIAHQLVSQGRPDAGERLWQAHCPSARDQLLNDGNFARATLNQSTSPFDWSFAGSSDLQLGFASAAGRGRALLIDGAPQAPTTVASQVVVVQPGTYQLSWRGGSENGQSAKIVAALGCDAQAPDWQAPGTTGAAGVSAITVTLDNHCAAHWLSLAVEPQDDNGSAIEPRPSHLSISNVVLSRMH